MQEAAGEEAENAHSHCIRREDLTAQSSVADAENIANNCCLHRPHQNAWRTATAIKQSRQVPPVALSLALAPQI
jgi:hypothetical protein